MNASARRLVAATAAIVVVATCALARAATPAGPPRGVHLSVTEDARTTMTVAWTTGGGEDPDAYVEYGPTEELGARVDATSAAIFKVDARTHEATIRGLEPGSTTYYRVAGSSGTSPVRSFRTARAGSQPFRFVAFGDQGSAGIQSQRTVDAVLAADPDLVVLAGDGPYADENSRQRWDEWFGLNEPFAAERPFMTAPGNHEYEGVFDKWVTYRQRLALPGEEIWYGFDYQNVHFLVLQTDRDAHSFDGTLDDMMLFAEQDLLAAARRRNEGLIDHIIVVQHHPLWGNQDSSNGLDERNVNRTMIAVEERWLHAYGVDLVIAAHNHHYERTKPMAYGVPTTSEMRSYVDPPGYIELILGGGGRSLYNFLQSDQTRPFTGVYAKRFHVGTFDVAGETITFRAIATDDAPGEFDTFTLTTTSP